MAKAARTEQSEPKAEPKDQTVVTGEIKTKPKVRAQNCTKVPSHLNTSVYRTQDPDWHWVDGDWQWLSKRNCKCNDCGHTWWQLGPPATEVTPTPKPKNPGPKKR